jgi:hypothetical protein
MCPVVAYVYIKVFAIDNPSGMRSSRLRTQTAPLDPPLFKYTTFVAKESIVVKKKVV